MLFGATRPRFLEGHFRQKVRTLARLSQQRPGFRGQDCTWCVPSPGPWEWSANMGVIGVVRYLRREARTAHNLTPPFGYIKGDKIN